MSTLHIDIDQLKFDDQNLIPAIVQDFQSKEVLMMAYMNSQSLQKTAETGETWFWSRSRRELWHKGATSGNVQHVKSISYDCDGDTLLIQVIPAGPACHNGTYSCFVQKVNSKSEDERKNELENQVEVDDPTEVENENGTASAESRFDIFNRLEQLIAGREAERPEGSYTTYLFDKGVDKILKKVGEEAAEVIIAAKNRSHEELKYEAGDLLFHLLVLLREQKLPLDEVLDELRSRYE